MADPGLICSVESCKSEITQRQADITEIFNGKGKPLCDTCYAKKIHIEKGEEWRKKIDNATKESAKRKVEYDRVETDGQDIIGE